MTTTKKGFIRTTGELRQRLADAILAVSSGKMSAKEANSISAKAAMVNRQLKKQLKEMRASHKAKQRGGKAKA